MKKYNIIFFFVIFYSCNVIYGQKMDKEILIKNLFLYEPYFLNNMEKNSNMEDFYKSFSFRIKELGECKMENSEVLLIDSMTICNNSFFYNDIFKDKPSYVIATTENKMYRLKGFSYNDFPFLLKYYLEKYEDFSVHEVVDMLNECVNSQDTTFIDFECIYEAFRAKEINYDYFPCIESFSHSKNEYLYKDCMQGIWKKKKGGEPFEYRSGSLYKK